MKTSVEDIDLFPTFHIYEYNNEYLFEFSSSSPILVIIVRNPNILPQLLRVINIG